MRKIISYALLILYVYFLYNTYILKGTFTAREGTGFTLFHLYDELVKNKNGSIDIYDVILKVVLMIPFGVLFPVARQKRCLSQTLTAGSILGLIIEIQQYVSQKGMAFAIFQLRIC